MGPRSHERGNSQNWDRIVRGPTSFRFNGAAFSRTRKLENSGSNGRAADQRSASMGPRSHERGNHLTMSNAKGSRTIFASMGPRSHERGNIGDSVSIMPSCQGILLQWGRVLTNAETQLT